jgi:hypothetical protein
MNTLTKHLPTAARLFLGLTFTVFGLNFFLHFLPMPPAPPRAAAFGAPCSPAATSSRCSR